MQELPLCYTTENYLRISSSLARKSLAAITLPVGISTFAPQI
jgi:hypothetical protein